MLLFHYITFCKLKSFIDIVAEVFDKHGSTALRAVSMETQTNKLKFNNSSEFLTFV